MTDAERLELGSVDSILSLLDELDGCGLVVTEPETLRLTLEDWVRRNVKQEQKDVQLPESIAEDGSIAV